MKRFVIPWISFFSVVLQAQTSSTGGITGTVTGDDGSRIAGARVGLLLQSPQPYGKAPQTFWSVPSGVDGSFTLSGLGGGTYRLCAEAPDTTWLNPCEWNLSPPVVSLTAGAPSATAVSVVLKKGVAVPIRIDDPSDLLQNEGRAPGAHLLIGAGTAISTFRSASIASQDAAGRNYQLVIPYSYAATLVVRSPFFKLSDASGVLLPSGAVIPITVLSGQTPVLVRLIVAGGSQ